MVTYNDDIVTNMLIGTDTLTPYLEKMMTLGKKVGMLQSKGLIEPKDMTKLSESFAKNSKALQYFNEGVKESEDRMKQLNNRFDMNILSWVFGGMALRNMGMTMMRFLIPPMDKLEQLQTNSAKKTMAVGAAFEFLKISVFETLSNTPMFQEFVEWLVKAAIWVSEFAQKHPTIVLMAAALAGIATALGTLAIGVGIFGQLEHLYKLINKYFGKDGTTGEIGKPVSGFSNLLKGLGATIAIGYVIKVNWDMLTSEDDAYSRFSSILKGTLGGAIAGALIGSIFGGVGALPGAAIGGAIGFGVTLAFSIYDYITEDKPTKEDFVNAIKDFFSSWQGVMGAVLVPLTGGLSIALPILFKMMANTDERIKEETNANNQIETLEKMGEKTQEVSEWAVQSYASIFSEQLKTDEQTTNLINNATKFGETISKVFGSSDSESGVISKFNLFGKEIIQDNLYFTQLKTEIDSWASTETVKVIKIRYEYDGNKPSEGFFERTGRTADTLLSSVTG